MNKILTALCIIGMSMLPTLSRSQGIESGQSMISLYGGLGTALQKSGLETNRENLSWGNIGGEIGLSYFWFPEAHVGIGADFSLAGFQGSEIFQRDVPGWWHWHTFESDMEMNTLHLMAAGRFNINPASNLRLYFPFGAGIVFTEGKIRYMWDGKEIDKESELDTSFGWYAGIGLEFDSSDRLAWGIEARYNSFRYDYNGLADYHGLWNGKEIEQSYISLTLHLSFK